jgi:replicative DNA helicase
MLDANIEAEQALLAAVLLDPAAFDAVADLFRPEIFAAHPAHPAIAESLMIARSGQKPLDPLVLLADLDARGLVPNPVPRSLPLDLARAAGTAANARYYGQVLQSLWMRRQAKQVARDVLAACRATG